MKPVFHRLFLRLKYPCLMAGCLVMAALLAAGCKQKSSVNETRSGNYFQTPFQTESEFIVQAVVSDLAQQMYYAARHQLPEEKSFQVIATQTPGASTNAPVYALQIRLDPKLPELKCDVAINGPIWSPEVYADVARQLALAVGLSPGNSTPEGDTALLARLKDNTPEIIEKENQRLSSALENDFTNSELHEQAAVLLGAFLLRDHSGYFMEIRSPLSRLTAHLAMAQFLRGSQPAGLNGQMAEALMLTLAGNEAPAMARLADIGTDHADVLPMVRALQTRNTGDYRILDQLGGLSGVESVEWFYAWANYVSTTLAWPKLSDDQKQTIDFVRAANDLGYSVEIGHQLLAVSIPLELREIESVHRLSQGGELTKGSFIEALNQMPDGCFSQASGGVQVHVIGWGQWADFLQRHLCHAIQQNFYFMESMWGVPDDAREFAAKCDRQFDGLRLYPFVRRFDCTDEAGYHQSVDDGFKVTVATPQLVPADCWNYLCYQVGFAPWYKPNPNPHVNEWHNPNPPPGTVYNLRPRLNHPSLTERPDTIPHFQQMHALAPYDCRLIYFLLKHQYHDQATYEQATNLFGALLPYSINAMRTVARTIYNQPEQYKKLMLQAAALDPVCYYTLGDYEISHHDDDLAAKYIDEACAADPDSVRVSNEAYWRVKYWLKKGQTGKARQIADDAGEVYSARGLESKAYFFEATSNYDGAFEWYAKEEERYDDSGPLVDFCERYKNLTGDSRFEPEVKKRVNKMFPHGMEKVSLADFHAPPTDGVSILQQGELLTAAGLRAGDVIVALNGTRTHTFNQYMFVRGLLAGPELDLIVWQGGNYHEIKASPPDHRFGVDFGDYRPQ